MAQKPPGHSPLSKFFSHFVVGKAVGAPGKKAQAAAKARAFTRNSWGVGLFWERNRERCVVARQSALRRRASGKMPDSRIVRRLESPKTVQMPAGVPRVELPVRLLLVRGG